MSEALIGLLGALIGAAATLVGTCINHSLEERRKNRVDEPRRTLLRQMLNNPAYEWRDIETLSGVIGASRDETARLLIKIGARRNEKSNGPDFWGYIEKHPLPK